MGGGTKVSLTLTFVSNYLNNNHSVSGFISYSCVYQGSEL